MKTSLKSRRVGRNLLRENKGKKPRGSLWMSAPIPLQEQQTARDVDVKRASWERGSGLIGARDMHEQRRSPISPGQAEYGYHLCERSIHFQRSGHSVRYMSTISGCVHRLSVADNSCAFVSNAYRVISSSFNIYITLRPGGWIRGGDSGSVV